MNSIDRSRRRLAVAAAALAGYVDATGFLSANSYFVSFMSGNTTRLGVDLVANPHTAVVPALLVLGFVVGVFGGALLAAKAGKQRKFAVLCLVAALLAGAAMAGRGAELELAMALLVLAMGALNNTFQRDGEVSVGLTYMTGALVRFAQGLAAKVLGNGGAGWESWLMLWLGLALGAVAGAFALLTWPAYALWLPAVWALVLALLARRIALS
ncbi:YoaK family protein [Novosphingobium sp. NPDC080210]|uniref:YoaK family protein n=1 Tax=Novosphingobium sp. NPDC080210 TaxID=3390596 RepID=UPI003D0447D1